MITPSAAQLIFKTIQKFNCFMALIECQGGKRSQLQKYYPVVKTEDIDLFPSLPVSPTTIYWSGISLATCMIQSKLIHAQGIKNC
jgi:hypothetical protein